MYVGHHDANNVSNFGGDQVTQLNLKNVLYYYLRCFTDMARRLQQYGRPYQPMHSPSLIVN